MENWKEKGTSKANNKKATLRKATLKIYMECLHAELYQQIIPNTLHHLQIHISIYTFTKISFSLVKLWQIIQAFPLEWCALQRCDTLLDATREIFQPRLYLHLAVRTTKAITRCSQRYKISQSLVDEHWFHSQETRGKICSAALIYTKSMLALATPP